jgi:hypothetical protein
MQLRSIPPAEFAIWSPVKTRKNPHASRSWTRCCSKNICWIPKTAQDCLNAAVPSKWARSYGTVSFSIATAKAGLGAISRPCARDTADLPKYTVALPHLEVSLQGMLQDRRICQKGNRGVPIALHMRKRSHEGQPMCLRCRNFFLVFAVGTAESAES